MESDPRAYWESRAEEYARTSYRATSTGQRYPFYETRRDRLFELLAPLPPGRLLDAGCGGGRLLLECLQAGWDAYGCDSSPRMVAIAREALSSLGFDANRVRETSLDRLAVYSDNSFDAIICMGVLEYIEPEAERVVFAEFRRVLRDDGWLFVENINGLFDLTTFNRFTVRFVRDQFLSQFFDEGTANEIGREVAGLLTQPLKPESSGIYGTTRDETYTKYEIPLVYGEKVHQYGFFEADQVFYRMHSAPPLVFEKRPEYEAAAIQREKELSRHWVARFIASGFISVLRKAGQESLGAARQGVLGQS